MTRLSGSMIRGSWSDKRPSAPGSQKPGAMPCGKKIPTNRDLGVAASLATSGTAAGSIASSSGSVRVHPALCKNFRRGMCRFVMNIELLRSLASFWTRVVDRVARNGFSHLHVHLERLAADDARDEGREAILIAHGVARDR